MSATLSSARPAGEFDDSGGPLWRRPALLRVFAWAAAVANGLIAVTGATVRVTGSGLGCATWPQCQPGSLVPIAATGSAALRQAIEFGNRTLTTLVLIASLGTFVLTLLARPRRRRIMWLAVAGPVGVLFQAVWGGVVVRTQLSWWAVAPHMLISLVLLFFAIAVVVGLREGDGPARPLVAPWLRVLTAVQVVVLAALCLVGTLVTAAGPHGGDAKTTRLDAPIPTLAHAHETLMFTFLSLAVVLLAGLLITKAARRVLTAMFVVVALTLAQGTLGIVQYALAIPAGLVVLHVLGAVCVVAASACLWFVERVR